MYHITFSLSALGTDTRHCLVIFPCEQTYRVNAVAALITHPWQQTAPQGSTDSGAEVTAKPSSKQLL